LSWKATIDGQGSVSPTTWYGVPVVEWFSGPGARDASTDGGDVVTIFGRYFSTAVRYFAAHMRVIVLESLPHLLPSSHSNLLQRFLGAVTYGATGTEYAAQNCSVTRDHFAITCYTTRGTGRFLRWSVTVGGQTSAASVNYTSYAAPFISSMSPANFPTDGGVATVLTGTDFASLYGSASVRVYLNNFNVATPTQAEQDSFVSQQLYGQDPLGLVDSAAAFARVQSWIFTLTEIVPLVLPLPAKSAGTLSFTIPPGFGRTLSAIVLVDGVPSNQVNFS
jgi:hypothetical protein